MAASATAPSERVDKRIKVDERVRVDERVKLNLLNSWENSLMFSLYLRLRGAYTCTFTAMGNLRPMPKDLEVTFSTGAACWRLYSERSTRRTTCWTRSSEKPFSRAICSGVS